MIQTVPPFIGKLEGLDEKWFAAAAGNQEVAMKPGALDAKTMLLIALAVDAYAGSTGVRGISDAARKNGSCTKRLIRASMSPWAATVTSTRALARESRKQSERSIAA